MHTAPGGIFARPDAGPALQCGPLALCESSAQRRHFSVWPAALPRARKEATEVNTLESICPSTRSGFLGGTSSDEPTRYHAG